MSPLEPSYPIIASSEYSTVLAQQNDLKTKFMKMIGVLKKKMNKPLKVIQGNTNKQLEEMKKNFKRNLRKHKQVNKTVQDLKNGNKSNKENRN